MRSCGWLFSMFLFGALLPSPGRTAEVRPISLQQALRAGGFVVPPEWAGRWAFDDTTRACNRGAIRGITMGIDTLCAGVSLEPDTTGGAQYVCTGTVTATEVDLQCTFGFSFEGCSVTYAQTIRASRNGDTATSFFRFSITSTPPLCAFMPDSCFEEYEGLARIGPAPPTCATPVEPTTWGNIKIRYR
jgi:hypothetical protein